MLWSLASLSVFVDEKSPLKNLAHSISIASVDASSTPPSPLRASRSIRLLLAILGHPLSPPKPYECLRKGGDAHKPLGRTAPLRTTMTNKIHKAPKRSPQDFPAHIRAGAPPGSPTRHQEALDNKLVLLPIKTRLDVAMRCVYSTYSEFYIIRFALASVCPKPHYLRCDAPHAP